MNASIRTTDWNELRNPKYFNLTNKLKLEGIEVFKLFKNANSRFSKLIIFSILVYSSKLDSWTFNVFKVDTLAIPIGIYLLVKF